MKASTKTYYTLENSIARAYAYGRRTYAQTLRVKPVQIKTD